MKKQAIRGNPRFVMIFVLFAVLIILSLGSPGTASASACSYLDYIYYVNHPQYTMPPECAIWVPTTTSTSTSTSTTPTETREPPPSTGAVSVGDRGGIVRLGDIVVQIQVGVLPAGSTVTLTRYPQNSVPTGNSGVAFQGPGDNRVGILVQDADGNTIRNVPPPGFEIAFKTSVDAYYQGNSWDIEAWNGGGWDDLPWHSNDPRGEVIAYAQVAWGTASDGSTVFVPIGNDGLPVSR